VKELEQKAEQKYVEGMWDITEVERYSGLSPFVSFFFSGGNVKKMIEEVLKNDSAFLFTKNDGRLTIRRFGLTYEYHKIPSWMTTQNPSKEFSESRTFMSSVAVQYNRNFESGKSESIFLYDEKETEIFEIYTKRNRITYETNLINLVDAQSLALRLFSRFSRRLESVKLGTGYDCSAINMLDTVELPVVINERSFSSFDVWTVLAVDPAQDKLEIEQYSVTESYIPGTMAFPSIKNESGVASHPSNSDESGETANPSIKKGE
jgi:hypothetical protein